MKRSLAVVLVLASGCVPVTTTSPQPPPPRVVEREPPPRDPPPPERGPIERGHGPVVRPHESVLVGMVVDARTHQPINGASVDITSPELEHSLNVQTGPDGRYRTEQIPSGEFAVRVRRDGFQVVDRHMTVPRGEAHLDFELPPK